MEIDAAYVLQAAHLERVLAQEVSRVWALHLAFPEARVRLLDEPHLILGEFHALSIPNLFKVEQALVPRLHVLPEQDLPHRGLVDGYAFRLEHAGYLFLAACRVIEGADRTRSLIS